MRPAPFSSRYSVEKSNTIEPSAYLFITRRVRRRRHRGGPVRRPLRRQAWHWLAAGSIRRRAVPVAAEIRMTVRRRRRRLAIDGAAEARRLCNGLRRLRRGSAATGNDEETDQRRASYGRGDTMREGTLNHGESVQLLGAVAVDKHPAVRILDHLQPPEVLGAVLGRGARHGDRVADLEIGLLDTGAPQSAGGRWKTRIPSPCPSRPSHPDRSRYEGWSSRLAEDAFHDERFAAVELRRERMVRQCRGRHRKPANDRERNCPSSSSRHRDLLAT